MSMQTLFNRLGNPILSALLRSPLHALVGGSMMLISVSGRRTGRVYTTPVNYVRAGDGVSVISFRERTWWRNLRGGAEVLLRLQGQSRRGRASVAEDEASVARALECLLVSRPGYAPVLGVSMQPDGTAHPEGFARAAQPRVVVRVQLT